MSFPAPADRAASAKAADPIGVMIVDDSAVARGLVTRWLVEEPEIAVLASKRTGRDALNALDDIDPDVIVLDIEMPEMDGLTALPLILQKRPGVVVIMASTLTRRSVEISLKALSLGALDCVSKPDQSRRLVSAADYRRELVDKIRALGRQRRRKTVPAVRGARSPAGTALAPLIAPSRTRPRVLVIGSSTGGPPALMSVMKTIAPAGGTLPILIAQHMPATFTGILAEHLARAAGRPAGEARDGEPVQPGRIYVAPGGCHMRVVDAGQPSIRLDDGPLINFCRPAVDPLFESAARIFGAATLAIVLTGMGHDGAAGASAIAEAGGSVIAQNEATSVVWGMPGAAVRAGACAAVLPLERIGRHAAEIIEGAGV